MPLLQQLHLSIQVGVDALINYEVTEKGNFHVAFYNVPISELNLFENNRGIETVNLTQTIGYANIGSTNEYKPYACIKAFSESALENLSIKLVEGRLPENEDEIVIPTHLKTNGRVELNVGDTITLDVGTRIDGDGNSITQNGQYSDDEEIVDTETKTYKIVGIIERPATNVESYSAAGYTFITYMDEENLDGNVDIYALYTDYGVENVYKITANILEIDETSLEKAISNDYVSEEEQDQINEEISKAKYQIDINSYLITLETNPLNATSVGELGTVAVIVIIIIVFTSVFCIKNSFDISITEKIKQYGMLRSIGATKKQIKKNVFFEATILGLIGIPLGIVSGLFATFILILISNYYLKDMLQQMELAFTFSSVSILIAVILGIITIYFSAFRSAKRASKVSPIDSIRNSGNIKIKAKKMKSPKFIKKFFGIGGEISYKNLKRNKKKYRTTVIAIIVSVIVFIAMYSFVELAFDYTEYELELKETNLTLYASDFDEELYKKFVETTSFDDIENYTILRTADLVIEENHYSQEYIDWVEIEELEETEEIYISIIALGEEQYEKYISSLGLDYDEIKDKTILVDYGIASKYDEDSEDYVKKYMRKYDFSQEDTITGLLNNEEKYSFEIGLVSEEMPFALQDYDGAVLIISDELYDEITTCRDIWIYYLADDADSVQDEIDAYLDGENYELDNSEENARIMNNLYTLVAIFLYGFIIVISLIGITNIFNTITTSMQLRRSEFAMLKSVGMTTKEFNKMIRLESLFMGLKALIIGIPIGIILSYLIYYFMINETGMPYRLPILAILITVIIVLILISIIMKYSINKINKQNTIETIRNENI